MIKGTINEFIDKKFKVNGQIPSRLDWSFILNFAAKAGTAKKVGSVPAKGGKGKPSVIWEVKGFSVEFE